MRFTFKVAIISLIVTLATELAIGVDWYLSNEKQEFATLQMGDDYYIQMIASKGVAELSICGGWFPWCEEGAIDWDWSRETIEAEDALLKRTAFGYRIDFPFKGLSGRDSYVRAPHWVWMFVAVILLAPALIHWRLKKTHTEQVVAPDS